MDMLIAFICVLVLGLAVAQFFLTAGAFKGRGKRVGGAGGEGDRPTFGGPGGHKSGRSGDNTGDSSVPGGDGGGE